MTGSSLETPAPSPLEDVRGRIARTAKIADRRASDVTLIAISKMQPVEAIRQLLTQGQRHFGENRVQEAMAKWPELRATHPDLVLHLVGQLQSNKAEEAVALFDVIHSLDRSSLVGALAKAMVKLDRRLPCFVQVNIGEEPQKGGCAIAALPELLAEVRAADIPVAGLMCVPPVHRPALAGGEAVDTEAPGEPAPYFALLAKLARDHGLSNLSMGMSGDYETAIMLGATHVRIGTALFGVRPPAE
jgi:pyridoxal phosphate enzyme (YggS family)